MEWTIGWPTHIAGIATKCRLLYNDNKARNIVPGQGLLSCIHRQTEQLLWNTNNSNKTYLQTRMATIGAQSTRHLFHAKTRQEDYRDYSLLVLLQVRLLALVNDLETTKGYPDQTQFLYPFIQQEQI